MASGVATLVATKSPNRIDTTVWMGVRLYRLWSMVVANAALGHFHLAGNVVSWNLDEPSSGDVNQPRTQLVHFARVGVG